MNIREYAKKQAEEVEDALTLSGLGEINENLINPEKLDEYRLNSLRRSVLNAQKTIQKRWKPSKKVFPVQVSLSFVASDLLLEIDNALVGTPNYMGLAYFWPSCDYKYILRELSYRRRRQCHAELLAAGIDLEKESPYYEKIVLKYKKYIPKGKML